MQKTILNLPSGKILLAKHIGLVGKQWERRVETVEGTSIRTDLVLSVLVQGTWVEFTNDDALAVSEYFYNIRESP